MFFRKGLIFCSNKVQYLQASIYSIFRIKPCNKFDLSNIFFFKFIVAETTWSWSNRLTDLIFKKQISLKNCLNFINLVLRSRAKFYQSSVIRLRVIVFRDGKEHTHLASDVWFSISEHLTRGNSFRYRSQNILTFIIFSERKKSTAKKGIFFLNLNNYCTMRSIADNWRENDKSVVNPRCHPTRN